MNFKQCLIVVLACFAATVTANSNVLYQQDSNMGLLNFMSRSNELLSSNPTRSVDCFNFYVPLINEIVSTYETNYRACVDASTSGRTIAEEATLEQRSELATKAQESCTRLSQCSELESVEDEFQCYITGGSENYKVAYGINVDATDELAELLEQFRLIENVEYKCTNETKRTYESESTQAYADLNDCIMGISEVPTEAPSTEAPSTEAPTTEAPTTEAPTTEAPTTEAPSTEAPSTDEPTIPDNILPEEDIYELRALKNLRYHLQQQHRK